MAFIDFINDLIGPSSKYCVVFQIFTIMYLIGILMYVGTFITLMINKKMKFDIAISLITATAFGLLFYQSTRLMYGLCLNAY